MAIEASDSLTFSKVSERGYEKFDVDLFLLELRNNFFVINGTFFENCRGVKTILMYEGKTNFAAMMEMLLLAKANGISWETAGLGHSSFLTELGNIDKIMLDSVERHLASKDL